MIETASDPSPGQEFTDRRIDQASAVSMRNLVQSGLKRSKVVTAHTYSVADVSFAVRGILEAEYASQVSSYHCTKLQHETVLAVVELAYPP